jgi:translation initiation factor 1
MKVAHSILISSSKTRRVNPLKLTSLSDLEKLLPQSGPSSPQEGKRMDGGKGATVHISLETKGRKGKSVTLVSGLQHNPDTMKDIARMLKEHCGVGGTVKARTIELQGDQRVRAKAFLEKMNYVVK